MGAFCRLKFFVHFDFFSTLFKFSRRGDGLRLPPPPPPADAHVCCCWSCPMLPFLLNWDIWSQWCSGKVNNNLPWICARCSRSSSLPSPLSIRRGCIGVRGVSITGDRLGGDPVGVCGLNLSGVAPVDGAGDRTASFSFSMGCTAPHVIFHHRELREQTMRFLAPLEESSFIFFYSFHIFDHTGHIKVIHGERWKIGQIFRNKQ